MGDCFNPRTRVGCDEVKTRMAMRAKVSIHAPVWGATLLGAWGLTGLRFQSTHPCGVRLNTASDAIRFVGFQSTHPCGVRPGK